MAELSDIIRKSLSLSIGIVAFTAEKAEEIVDDLVEKGEITREQGLSMMRDIVKRGEETRKEFRRMVKAEVKKALDEADIPSKSDIKNIEAKLDRLLLMQAQHEPAQEAGEEPAEAI